MDILHTPGFQKAIMISSILASTFLLAVFFYFLKISIDKKKAKKIATACAIAKNEWKTCYSKMSKYLENVHKFYRRRKEKMPPEIVKEFIGFRNICIGVIVYTEPIPKKEEVANLINEYQKLHSSIQSKMLQGKAESAMKSDAIQTMKLINEEILTSLQRILAEVSK